MAPPLSSLPVLDEGTAQAVEVLALAVQRERVPGIVEFGVASDALARAATSRDVSDLEYATVAFDSLDPDFRSRIVTRAYELARSERGRLRMPQLPPPVDRPIAVETSDKGAGRARSRLMADLGRRGKRITAEVPPEDLAPTLEEIIPMQPVRYDGPPPKWWE